MKVATTHKGKKILEDREPKFIENRKRSLFIRGRKTSQELDFFWEELAKFRRNEIEKFSRKNDILPFESVDEIQKACKNHHCSLFTFFSSNKKRPMNVVFGRLFDDIVMEMYEFGVQNFQRTSENLKKAEYDNGALPALIFQGDQWETEYAPIRSMFMDFFVGELKEFISIDQIQHLLTFTIVENGESHYIAVRHYQVVHGNATNDLIPVAPSFDLVPRRQMLPDNELMQKALEKPAFDKKKKNITKNELGQIHGRVFTPKQKTDDIVPKGFKGLPKLKQKQKFERPAEPADDVL